MNSIARRIINKTYQLLIVKKKLPIRVDKIISQNNSNISILFVCSGNICRSAFAEKLLKKLSQENNLKLEIDSAGTYTNNDLPANADAIRISENFGINLKDHKTKKLTEELLDKNDLIFAMEPSHLFEILITSPKAISKVFLLSSFDDSKERMILDPYGKGDELFNSSFNRIVNCCKLIIKKLAKSSF